MHCYERLGMHSFKFDKKDSYALEYLVTARAALTLQDDWVIKLC